MENARDQGGEPFSMFFGARVAIVEPAFNHRRFDDYRFSQKVKKYLEKAESEVVNP